MVYRSLLILTLLGVGCASTTQHLTPSEPESTEASTTPKPSILEDLRRIHREEGIEAVVHFYCAAQDVHHDRYRIEEGDLKTLGYELMGAGRLSEALTAFAVNREYHPTSSAYLAQGYGEMALGDLWGALETFEHALELDPSNEIAASLVMALTPVKTCEACLDSLRESEEENWDE